jgi:hypothetical protein
MTKRRGQRDLVDRIAEWLAHNKGLPVFVGVGLVLVSLLLSVFPSLAEAHGFLGWLMRSHLLLHVGIIVGLLGILLGDAL